MNWNELWLESGWVAVVKGIKSDGSFKISKSSYLIPLEGKDQACKNRLATYELTEGNVYMIDSTGNKEYRYAVVSNDEVKFISRPEAVEQLIELGYAQPHQKSYRRTKIQKGNHSNIEKNNNSKQNTSHSSNLEFHIEKLEFAFQVRNEKQDKSAFDGMIFFSWEFAKRDGITENQWQKIFYALEEGRDAKDIKKMFETPQTTSNTYHKKGNRFNLGDYNVPIPVV